MQSGQILRNHYKIIKSLGTGGFGDTYLAQDLDLPGNPKCVVKHLKPKSLDPIVLNTATAFLVRGSDINYLILSARRACRIARGLTNRSNRSRGGCKHRMINLVIARINMMLGIDKY